MVKYIKLGLLGDYFFDNKIGVYLNKSNASEVNSELLKTRLYNFLVTGFIIEIELLEYDNIKLKSALGRNIPLNILDLNSDILINPVESVILSPVIAQSIGERYLIGLQGLNQWANKGDYIAEWNGIEWVFIKPRNTMILPVYSMGISLHYTGTYPSGSWDLSEAKKLQLKEVSPEVIGDQSLFLKLLEKEAKIRFENDADILKLIDGIEQSLNKIKLNADSITLKDTNNYYSSNNVEGALIEVFNSINSVNDDITSVKELLNTTKILLEDFIASDGNQKYFFGPYILEANWEIKVDPISGLDVSINPYFENHTVYYLQNLWQCLIDAPLAIPGQDDNQWLKITNGSNNPQIRVANIQVGGINAGDNYSVDNIEALSATIRKILEATFNPTFQNPSFSLNHNQPNLIITGDTKNVGLSISINKGRIIGTMVSGIWQPNTTQNDLIGNTTKFIQGNQIDVLTENNYTVVLGYNMFNGNVSYLIGPQPLNNLLEPFSTPHPAGNSGDLVTGFEGVYPSFATIATISSKTQMALISHYTTGILDIQLVAESDGLKQYFELSDAFLSLKVISSIKYFNTVSNQFDNTNKLSDFTITNSSNTLFGNSIGYKKYQHNGANRGSILIRIQF